MGEKREIVVVTGGTAGIGRATVHEFAAHGADVAVLARGEDRLRATCREVEAAGGRALGLSVDVADHDAVEAAAARIEDELGPIDVWVNNAFAGIFSTFMDMSDEEYRRVTDVTYMGQVHGVRAALKRMLPRDSGTIVLVGSALAYRGIPLQSAYCAAKHAIRGFTESLRCELIHEESPIAVTEVHLPAINTPQFDWARARIGGRPSPVPPIFEPEEAADAILHAAANPDQREYWLGRSTAQVILGNMLVPAFLDRFLAHNAWEAQSRDSGHEHTRDNLYKPERGLHRTRGSFGWETKSGAALLPGRDAVVHDQRLLGPGGDSVERGAVE